MLKTPYESEGKLVTGFTAVLSDQSLDKSLGPGMLAEPSIGY